MGALLLAEDDVRDGDLVEVGELEALFGHLCHEDLLVGLVVVELLADVHVVELEVGGLEHVPGAEGDLGDWEE